jgi:hypothetical protein
MRIIKVPLVLNLIQFDLPIPIIQKPPVINKNDNEKIPLLENNFYSEPEFTVSVQQTNYSYHMSSNRISSDELQKYIK